MANLSKTLTLERQFRNLFASYDVSVSIPRLLEVFDEVAEIMGIKNMCPAHPKISIFMNAVFKRAKIIQNKI